MKNRYRIYIRGKNSGGKVWMIQDNKTGKRESLHTTDKHNALQMLLLKNRPHQDAGFHAQMAHTHILVSNPENAVRTWQSVMDDVENDKKTKRAARWLVTNAPMRAKHLTTSASLGRAPVVLMGFLEFLNRNKDVLLTGGNENRKRIRRLAKFLNMHGGVCILDSLSQPQIMGLLETELARIQATKAAAATAA